MVLETQQGPDALEPIIYTDKALSNKCYGGGFVLISLEEFKIY